MVAKKVVFSSLAVAVGLIVLVTVIILYTTTGGKVSFDYGLVLDAGSSKTAMTMFKWPADQIENTGVVEQVGDECRTKGGIDDLGDDVNTTIDNLVPCLKTITALIEKDESGRTPNYLAATAGMRIVDLQDPKLARMIMDSVGNFLGNFTVNDTIKYDVVVNDIISGADEGLFAWITVNYLLKTLKLGKHGPVVPTTFGILDLGGGSRQIAYQDIHEQLPIEQVINTKLYGINYKIRTTTVLCFGGDEIWNRHVYMLIKNDNKLFVDPCMLKGSTIKVIGSDLARNPCLKTKNGNNNVREASNYTLSGTGNFDACLSHVNEMVSKCNDTFTICLKDEDQPPPKDMKLIATSGYYHATKTLSIKEKTTQKDFLSLTKTYCSQNWSDVKKDDRTKMDCLKGVFIYESWTKKYKFNATTFENIEFREKLVIDNKNVSISWAMGLMINATNAIPPEDPSEPIIKTLPFSLVTAACVIVIIIGILLAIKFQSDIQAHIGITS